jgi:SET domain-containing protein
MSEPIIPKRKFYQEDLEKYFLVEFIKNSIIDPDIVKFLDNYDITADPEFSDENVQRRVALHRYYFDHGFVDDRRIYAAFISKEMGFGAYADIFIPAWTIVGEYVGVISSKSFNTDYAWIYHSKPSDAEGNILKLRVNARTHGNMTRFLNHSDYPNCSVIHVPYKNRWRTLYITNSNIMPDEELTVYYGEIYWKTRGKEEEN